MKTAWGKIVAFATPFLTIVAILYGCGAERTDVTNGSGPSQPNADDTCKTEGAVRDCHAAVSVKNGVRTCMHGTQVCSGGRWSTCGATGESTLESRMLGVSPSPEEEEASGVRPQTHVGAGDPDANACRLNPCTPDCRGYDEDAGPLTTDASLKFDAVVGTAATPPGFVDKLLRDKTNGWGADCERWETGNSETGHVHSACQSDYYCQRHASGGTDGRCAQFKEGPNETHAAKLGGSTNGGVECLDAYPDLTLGTPCGLGGAIITPICNRGAAPVPAGTVITVAEEGPSPLTPTAPTNTGVPDPAAPMAGCPTFTADCSITLAAPLDPGYCIRFSSAQCSGGFSGNGSLYVNANAGVRECVIQPRVLGPPISAHGPTVEQNLQYGCANNWTGFNASQIPACVTFQEPKVVTYGYNGTCPAGTVPQWTKLAWSSSTPTTTSILFEIRVRSRLADGGFGDWGPWVAVGRAKQSSAPPDDPQNCPMNGPAPCPKDLFAPLSDAGASGIAARGEELELRISLNPAGMVGPTLYSYNLAYACVARE